MSLQPLTWYRPPQFVYGFHRQQVAVEIRLLPLRFFSFEEEGEAACRRRLSREERHLPEQDTSERQGNHGPLPSRASHLRLNHDLGQGHPRTPWRDILA